ncbi:MAG: DinB family protein [Thermomicrobiales bacterium]
MPHTRIPLAFFSRQPNTTSHRERGDDDARRRHAPIADRPTITAYDQEEYARVLHYDRPIAPSLAAFKAARDCTAPLLHLMTPEDWSREGVHVESGPYRAEDWLRIYAAHAHAHADQIRRARAAAP